jgi:hypothetical protein
MPKKADNGARRLGSWNSELNRSENVSTSTQTKWGYLDRTGQLAIDFEFDHAGQFNEGLAVVNIGDKMGFIDTTGNLLIAAQYGAETQNFFDGLAMVETDGGECGFIDRQNDFIVPPVYEWARCFSEERAFVRAAGKCGYVARDGTVVVKPRYENAGDYSCGVASVYDGKRWRYIDKCGEPVRGLPGGSGGFHEGVAGFWRDGTCALLTLAGEVIKLPDANWVSEYCSNGRIGVRVGNLYGYIDQRGRLVIDAKFDDASTFSEDLADVRFGARCGYIDTTGKTVIPPRFDEASFFHEGLARVKQGRKDGFIDTQGQMVFTTEYKAGFPFSEGLTPVYTD